MQPDPSLLIEKLGLTRPLVGLYDAPDPEPFAPLVEPKPGKEPCVFDFYRRWVNGETVHVTADNHGCEGCGRYLFGLEESHEELLEFLVDEEGLFASRDLAEEWMASHEPYRPRHDHLLLGPLRAAQYEFLRTVTFWVDADQLACLCLGAQYDARPSDAPPVVAPFGSGCMQLAPLFADLEVAQALIGATDISIRAPLPPEVLAFTVTRAMFERLCRLDEESFLFKPFWRDLRKARARQRGAAGGG